MINIYQYDDYDTCFWVRAKGGSIFGKQGFFLVLRIILLHLFVTISKKFQISFGLRGESDPYTSHPKNLYDDYIIVFNICSMVM